MMYNILTAIANGGYAINIFLLHFLGGIIDMKKFLAILSAMMLMGSAVSCSKGKESEKSGSAQETNSKKTIGIALPTKTLERWNRDGEYLKEQFEEAGYNVELKFSDYDTEKQNNDIKELIDDKVSLLLVAAADGATLSETLVEAKNQGIPVIAYDRLIMNSDSVSYYVSFNNYAVGKMQGEYIVKTLDLDNTDGPYNIEFVAGDVYDNNAKFFFNGAYDVLKPFIASGKVQTPSGKTTFQDAATKDWATAEAKANMINTLETYYSDDTVLDAVLCANDSTALGVADAIEAKYEGENVPILTGQDGDVANIKNIVDGKQSMTVYKNFKDEAGVALEVAKIILSGEKPDAGLLKDLPVSVNYDTNTYNNGFKTVPSYLLIPTVVTKSDLQILVDSGLYKWDDDNVYLESTSSAN